MEKTALFPGSFDPFTVGHEEIVNRGLKLFDKIIIAVGINALKKEFLDINCRVELIKKVFRHTDRVSVVPYSGLTVDFCREMKADAIIRGLRTAADFEYERAVGQANRAMAAEVETVFILTSTVHTFISSTIVRNVYMNGGNVDQFLPDKLTTEDLRLCDKNIQK
ncbi:pantetheine-phosphate adenylyltransferase [Odoribacter lunatus]|uniref:pantetheine-phosphate adenylyltransferase n=1 Tax=Odoribacter lunatus TaxID=2941335 RepID=UPI002041B6E2|nr:pantetheine-phosphate adenylyltransferase [Odoribacter lunatus]